MHASADFLWLGRLQRRGNDSETVMTQDVGERQAYINIGTFFGPTLLLLLAFFVLPVLGLLLRSVLEPTLGLSNYTELFASSTYARVLFNTFYISAMVTIIAVIIGFPIAWLLAILPGRWPQILLAVIILSMWTGLLTRTYAWMILLQRTGLINKFLVATGVTSSPLALVNNSTGVIIGMIYIMLPFIILPLLAKIKAIDPSILRAAALCGGNRWQCFSKVLLPLAVPGIAAGALMVFVMSLGYFVTPALLGGASSMMLAELIVQLIQSLTNWGLGGAAAFVLLVATLILYMVQLRYFNPYRRD